MSARVLVVDCHPVTRWGIGRLLDEQADLSLAGEAATPGEALRLTAALVPGVVVDRVRAGRGAAAAAGSRLGGGPERTRAPGARPPAGRRVGAVARARPA